MVLFNFRGDRAIEIARTFDEENLTEFDRGPLAGREVRGHHAVRCRSTDPTTVSRFSTCDRFGAGRTFGGQRQEPTGGK